MPLRAACRPAALAVLWLAANAPGREAFGFLAGAAATLVVVLVFV